MSDLADFVHAGPSLRVRLNFAPSSPCYPLLSACNDETARRALLKALCEAAAAALTAGLRETTQAQQILTFLGAKATPGTNVGSPDQVTSRSLSAAIPAAASTASTTGSSAGEQPNHIDSPIFAALDQSY